MESKIKKLKEFTEEVKTVINDLYREGSVERNNIRDSEVVNTLSNIAVMEELEKLTKVEFDNGLKLDKLIEILSQDEPKSNVKTPAKK